MDDRREIDLERSAYRPVLTGPLGKYLGWSMAGAAVLIVIAGIGGWLLATWWSAYLAVPPAILFGIAWAGLDPGHWFREPPDKT